MAKMIIDDEGYILGNMAQGNFDINMDIDKYSGDFKEIFSHRRDDHFC